MTWVASDNPAALRCRNGINVGADAPGARTCGSDRRMGIKKREGERERGREGERGREREREGERERERESRGV